MLSLIVFQVSGTLPTRCLETTTLMRIIFVGAGLYSIRSGQMAAPMASNWELEAMLKSLINSLHLACYVGVIDVTDNQDLQRT